MTCVFVWHTVEVCLRAKCVRVLCACARTRDNYATVFNCVRARVPFGERRRPVHDRVCVHGAPSHDHVCAARCVCVCVLWVNLIMKRARAIA